MAKDLMFVLANENELNELAAGRAAGAAVPWSGNVGIPRIPNGTFGVLLQYSYEPNEPLRPLAIIAGEEDHRRLCGRFAQLRSDLSPLTTWCHLLTPQRFEPFDDAERNVHLYGCEAAWTGLIIAEAVLLAERPVSKLRLASCLATQTFAIARSRALWDRVATDEVLGRFDAAQKILRSPESKVTRLRSALKPIWASLAGVAGSSIDGDRETRAFVSFFKNLAQAKNARDDDNLGRALLPLIELVPEAERLLQLGSMTPEKRLEQYDFLVDRLSEAAARNDHRRRSVYAMMAGYVATIAAGGAASLGLTEAIAENYPEVTAWAYTIGGIGEHVTWTSSFDGLGRLVARELTRSFRLTDGPVCDISIDEANALVDYQLSDPLVHLKIKQARLVTVALLPGVNIAVPIVEAGTSEKRRGNSIETTRHRAEDRPSSRPSDSGGALAELLWPFLQGRIEELIPRLVAEEARRGRSVKTTRSRKATSSGLPFDRKQTDE